MSQFLLTLRDADIFPNREAYEVGEWNARKTVKVVLCNSEGKIALVTNPVHQCLLLPGGGVEDGEAVLAAADRECQEEVGYAITTPKLLGVVEEFRGREGFRYESSVVLAETGGKIDADLRTETERENGLTAVWVTTEDAEQILRAQVRRVREGNIDFYNTAFNIIRDYRFFQEGMKYLNAQTFTVDSIPFGKIVRGEKVVESRLWDAKRQRITAGDILCFTERDHPQHVVYVRVVDLLRGTSFKELFMQNEPSRFGGTDCNMLLEEIHQFYSSEDEWRYGVVGIRFEIVEG